MSQLLTKPSCLFKILWHVWKKKKNWRRNVRHVTFLEAKKMVGSYMGENTYASVAWRVDPIRQSNQENRYKAMMEKLIQLKPNNLPKFQEHLKNLHLVKFQQPQTQWNEVTNKEKPNEVVQGKTQTTPLTSRKSPAKQFLHKSPICLPKTVRQTKKPSSPKARTTQTKTTSSHWPTWKNTHIYT